MAFFSGRTSFICGIGQITVCCYRDMRFIHFVVFLFCLMREFPMLQKKCCGSVFLEDSVFMLKYFVSKNYLIV